MTEKNILVKEANLPYDELEEIVKKSYHLFGVAQGDKELISRQVAGAIHMLQDVLHAKEFYIYLNVWSEGEDSCESAERARLADPNSYRKPIVRETLYTIVNMPHRRQRYDVYIDLPNEYFFQ